MNATHSRSSIPWMKAASLVLPPASRLTELRTITEGTKIHYALDGSEPNASSNAYEKVVDRLLKSPRFGERWARQWLDLARYADSNGYQYDGPNNQWPWRDWVINAFKSHMTFDQFVTEQLAIICAISPTTVGLLAS